MTQRGLTVDILVNNAGFTTMGPVHRADHAAELAMVRTNVEAVVDLCTLFVPGHGHPAPRRRPQHGVDRGVPAAAGSGRLRRVQGLRALLRPRARAPSSAATGVTVTTLCPGPVETGFAEAAGLTDAEASESLPKFMWVPAAEVAKAAVDGLAAGRPVVIPGAANRAAAALAHLAPKSLILPLLAQRHPALKPDQGS